MEVTLKTDHKLEDDANQVAELNVKMLTKPLNATAISGDMYSSIDDMADKLKVQLEKYKQTHAGHKL